MTHANNRSRGKTRFIWRVRNSGSYWLIYIRYTRPFMEQHRWSFVQFPQKSNLEIKNVWANWITLHMLNSTWTEFKMALLRCWRYSHMSTVTRSPIVIDFLIRFGLSLRVQARHFLHVYTVRHLEVRLYDLVRYGLLLRSYRGQGIYSHGTYSSYHSS